MAEITPTRTALDRLEDAMEADILATPKDELLAEAVENGDDPAAFAARMRAFVSEKVGEIEARKAVERDRIKAFLDDLALISFRHGMRIDCGDADVLIEEGDVQGYVYNTHDCRLGHCWWTPKATTEDEIASLDAEKATAHQRLSLTRTLAEVRRHVD